jgi:hypothetical protein
MQGNSGQAPDRDLFIVTSAIRTPWGRGDQERFEETLRTISSIQEKVNADIWLCESSAQPIEDTHRAKLEEFADFIPFHEEGKEIKDQNLGMTYVKSRTEATMLAEVFRYAMPYKRVFKLSGRYYLNEHFNREDHDQPEKLVCREVMNSGWSEEQIGTTRMIMTRLYSFDPSIKNDLADVFDQIGKYLYHQAVSCKVGDIEHGLYKYLPPEYIHEVFRIGVRGRIGHINSVVED